MAETLPVKTRKGKSELMTVFWNVIATEHRSVAMAALSQRDDIKKPTTWYSRGAVDREKPSMKGAWRQASSAFTVPDRGITPITKANPVATIGFMDRDASGDNPAAEIAKRFDQLFRSYAPVGRRRGKPNGRYKSSLFFILNRRHRSLPSIMGISRTFPLNNRETIIISSSAAEYASAIEAAAVLRGEGGIFRKIALQLISEYGARASLKFTYIDNVKLGVPYKPQPGWKAQGAIMLPVLLIGGPGQFPSSATANIGKARRKRNRDAQRAKLRKKGHLK